MGGLTNGGAFLTDTVLAINDGRLEGQEIESEGKAVTDGLELLLAGDEVFPINLPVAIPVFAVRLYRSGDAGASAIKTFGVEEFAARRYL